MRANSLADISNSEPGPPTWPNLIWVSAACAADVASANSDPINADLKTFIMLTSTLVLMRW